jgi:hypothetical protein
MPIFLWDVESSPNYTEKLIFAGIGTTLDEQAYFTTKFCSIQVEQCEISNQVL